MKVDSLKPASSGFNIFLKVVGPKKATVVKGNAKLTEILVGDETGCILFTVRNGKT